jgi:hypothetical protein
MVVLPDDLERLVEQVYGSEPLAIPGGWEIHLDEYWRKLGDQQRAQRMAAKGVMIYTPGNESVLSQPNLLLREDDPEAHRRIRAATRDTEPTVQLVVIYRRDGKDTLHPGGSEPIDVWDRPDIPRTRRILDNEVTISHLRCVAFYAKAEVPVGWRDCGMLRYHRVVRVDPNGKSLPGEYPLTVDPELGLLFSRDPEVEDC